MIQDKEKLQAVKDRNFNAVCMYLKVHRKSTIPIISQKTGLSLPTVTKIINFGLENNVFFKSDLADSTGGRNARIYCINEDYLYTLLIVTDNEKINWRVINFCGVIKEKGVEEFEGYEFINIIDSIILNATSKYFSLKVCGISLPCIIDRGKVRQWTLNPYMKGFDVKKHIEDKFHIKTIIENDMKLLAFEARKYRKDENDSCIVAIQLGSFYYGVGTTINGKILSGKSGFAGEVSYLPVKFRFNDIEDTGYKILTSCISLLNPDLVVFYMMDIPNIVESIMELIKKDIPDYAIPDYVVLNNGLSDMFLGLENLSEPLRTISGCV